MKNYMVEENPTAYKAMRKLNALRIEATDFIKDSVLKQYSGIHDLDNDTETFYEGWFEDDNEWKICHIKVDDEGEVWYAHSEPIDEDDWHLIGSLNIEDLVHIMSFYKG